MTDRDAQLLKVLRIGHETSMRGTGISLCEALNRARYKELRAGFDSRDLVPVIKAYRALTREWIAYSEDKRTSGGWYLSNQGEIGQAAQPESREQLDSLPEAIAKYVIRELDFWAGLQDGR